jgi:predicted nucleic acid-binding protein
MTADKYFVDTNILIYAYDLSAGEKHEKAKRILIGLWETGGGMLSLEVLQEFFVNITRKVSKPLEVNRAKEIIQDFLKWDLVLADGESVVEAIELHDRYQFSFWDAMILQAALRGGASFLLSEDLAEGQTIGGLKIKNPFRGADLTLIHNKK